MFRVRPWAAPNVKITGREHDIFAEIDVFLENAAL
jgi:hypothetical protein